MIVFGDHEFGHRIAGAAGAAFNPATDQCIARVEDGELLGGSVYTAYTGASIGVHIAGFVPNWIDRDMLWVGFHYPFVQLGCRKLLGQVPSSNTKAIEFDLKIGFKIEAVVKDVFPDGDLLVMAMYRDECRHLKMQPRSLAAPKRS